MIDNNQEAPSGFGLAMLLFTYFVMSLAVALAWNCGLYGSGLADHKISFITAIGLAVALNIIRYVLSGVRSVTQHVTLNRTGER